MYLNASPQTANQRSAELAQFMPPGAANSQLGWNGSGSLALQSEQVAGVKVQDAQHAVVTLLARVNGRLMELGVPVYASAGALVVPGEPGVAVRAETRRAAFARGGQYRHGRQAAMTK